MYRLSANLEWLFTEAGERIDDRVRAAAAHGFELVEIWNWHGRDLVALRAALDETDTTLLTLVVNGQPRLTDTATHDDYLRGLEESLGVALRLGAPNIVVNSGDDRTGASRSEQHDALVSVFGRAAAIVAGSGVTILLEPLNSAVDHVGTFLTSTAEGLQILREVGRPEVKLLFDAYHQCVMGEDIEMELAGSIDLVGHIQIADVPGRHEIGSGSIDWAEQLTNLDRLGYRGAYGLEYRPSGSTVDSLMAIEEIARLGPVVR